jgi:hypothetical protein
LPELALIAGTRVAVGAGLGLLLADRFTAEQRRAAGWTLLLFGGLSTIPLAMEVFGGRRRSTRSQRPKQTARRLADRRHAHQGISEPAVPTM